MKRASFLLFAMFAVLAVLLFPASQITFSEKTSATVRVDCAKGDSINAALLSDPKAQRLTVEISGMCHENVVVTRDRVTLRGTDSANDGIQAVENIEPTDAVVWVRGAALFTIENLTLTGGFSGLLATNANHPILQVTNCRLAGNNNFGIQLENALVNSSDTSFESVANGIPAGVFLSSRLACSRCFFKSQGPTVAMIIFNSLATINQSAFEGGPIRAEGSTINVSDTTISTSMPGIPGINALNHNSIVLTRVDILGRMFFGQGTTAVLNGVTQLGVGPQPNEASVGSNVVVGSAGQPTGGPPNINSTLANFDLSNFSNLVLRQGSIIEGDMICRAGSNAQCQNPANVIGATNCGLCPKP